MKTIIHYKQTFILSAVFAFFLAIDLPLQSYLRNISLYNFSTTEFVIAASCFFIGCFLALSGLLIVCEKFLGRYIGRIPHVMVLALLICGYLETGVLSIGLPPLNGELTCYQTLTFRKYVDTFSLLGVFLAVTLCYKWMKGVLHYVSLGLLVMFLASLFDVKTDEMTGFESKLEKGLFPQSEVLKSLVFSQKKNVIVFVLDSAQGTRTAEMASNDKEISQLYPGFVAYRNNISMHDCTVRGLPAIVTGKYMEPEQSTSEYAATLFGEDSFVMPYVMADRPVYFVPDLFAVGYTNRRIAQRDDGVKNNENPLTAFFRPTKSVPFQSLADVLEFRLTPTLKKYYVLARIFRRAKAATGDVSLEDSAYPIVENADVSKEQETTLFFLHTKGLHFMITKDRNGNKLPKGRFDVESVEDYTPYLLKQLGHTLMKLRRNGVYDKSMIVITADHGNSAYTENPEDPKTLGQYSTMLWVKPMGAQAEFRMSNMPTSSSKIAELVKRSEKEDFTLGEIEKILYTKERLFRGKPGRDGRSIYMIDWVYDEDAKIISNEMKGPYLGT